MKSLNDPADLPEMTIGSRERTQVYTQRPAENDIDNFPHDLRTKDARLDRRTKGVEQTEGGIAEALIDRRNIDRPGMSFGSVPQRIHLQNEFRH